MATSAAASTVPSTTTADNVPAELPWHAALPAPRSTPSKMTCDELAQWIRGQDGQNKKEWLVVDVRRTDFEVAFIRGAINLPAHSFYQTLPGLLPILTQYRSVIFHCQSSNGRGPRCAGWYQDALDDISTGGEAIDSRAVVLESGIKGWCARFGEDKDLTVKL